MAMFGARWPCWLDKPPNYLTHPFKVEGYAPGRHASRSVLVGRAMFRTEEEALQYAKGARDDGDLPVLRSKRGDTEFA